VIALFFPDYCATKTRQVPGRTSGAACRSLMLSLLELSSWSASVWLTSTSAVADVPDESGELLTQYGAQDFIEDLKKQLAERG
jgi:hypothetical protein